MAEEKTAHTSDAAAAVRAKRASSPKTAKPQAALATVDGDGAEKTDRPLEVTGHAPAPAHTLVGSFVAGHITSSDYVSARADGYYAWYPDGCLQPSCQKLWQAGQMVLREVYDRYGGDATPATPRDAVPVNQPGGAVVVPTTPGVHLTV